MGAKNMITRRVLLLVAGAAAFIGPTAPAAAAGGRDERWSSAALAAAESALEAVKRHPFVTGAYAGTLTAEAFGFYLRMNLSYLENYARVLDEIGARLKREAGFTEDAARFLQWARETRDLHSWTKDYAERFPAGSAPATAEVVPALAGYMHYESTYAEDKSLAVAVVSAIPCFWIWDEFARALRPAARIEGNPYREWVEPMGTEAAAASARSIIALADKLAERETPEVRARMTDIFAAGCWYEWMLFEAAVHAAPKKSL